MPRPLRRFDSPRSVMVVLLAALIALAVVAQAPAAPPALSNVTGVTSDGASVMLAIGTDQLSVRVCAPGIVRVDYRRNGQADPDTPVIDPKGIWPGDAAATINTSSSPIVLKTARLAVQID